MARLGPTRDDDGVTVLLGVEFGAIKKKFGDSLKSKNLRAQRNELICKFIAYKITVVIHEMHESGIAANFCTSNPVAAPRITA